MFLLFLSSIIFTQYVSFTGFAFKESVFIDLQLKPEYSQVESGGDILLGMRLIRHEWGTTSRGGDVTVHVFIEGHNNSVLLLASQTTLLDRTGSLLFRLMLPRESTTDSYHLYVEAKDTVTDDLLGFTRQKIIVLGEGFFIKFGKYGALYLFIAFVLLIIMIIMIIMHNLNSFNQLSSSRSTRNF